MKKQKIIDMLIYIFLIFGFSAILCGIIFLGEKSKELNKKVEFYEQCESVREAEILEVTDCVVIVYDDYINALIEVDIFWEFIHTTIEVGDIAVYAVDYNYTDADLLAIIKK